MWALNGGTQISSPGIALKIMPAVYVEVSGGTRRKLKKEAVVYLNIPVSSDPGFIINCRNFRVSKLIQIAGISSIFQ